MDFLRGCFDNFYDLIKPAVFCITARNPEPAHHLFVSSLNVLKSFGLASLVLDNSSNDLDPGYEISNGAGLNKNGEIDPRLMNLLGFDRVVVGTVTYDAWAGNPKPRIRRFVGSGSIVNWMGLPGIGAEKVARSLERYGAHRVPLTINLMFTPGKRGREALRDLRETVLRMREVPYVDRFEPNISCPNTHSVDGSIDARSEYAGQLDGMLDTVTSEIGCGQELYLKVSPDVDRYAVDEIVSVGEKYGVRGYTTTNATTNHLPRYIDVSLGKGGASGNAVWDASVRTQKYFDERVGDGVKLIACGGINSRERARERCSIGNCDEVQVFTPLIFEGTRLVRKLRDK